MDRLKSEIWVQACQRRCQGMGIFTTVARRGDKDAGLVMIKFYESRDRVEAFIETRDAAGQMVWRCLTDGPVPEHAAEEAMAKQISFDRDLWIIEIERGEGSEFLLEPVI